MIQKEMIQSFMKKICSAVGLRIILLVLCALTASVCYSCRRNDGVELVSEENPSQESSVVEENLLQDETLQTAEESSAPQSSPAMIYVQICGQVVSPGVYQVPEDSRIFEVLDLAGGYTDLAAKEYLNLADVAVDGMKLIVPSVAELEQAELYGAAGVQGGDQQSGSAQAIGNKVNLNTATKEELMTLRGIGEAKAEDILQYRSTHGPFEKIEDIKQISGIKDAAFEKIKDSITV